MSLMQLAVRLPLVLDLWGALEAADGLRTFNRAVQLLSNDEGKFPALHCPTLRLRVADTLTNTTTGPQLVDCRRILAFTKGIEPSSILIHCLAGRSRSTATALLVLAQFHGKAAFSAFVPPFFRRYPESDPNARILALGGALLGWNLVDCVRNSCQGRWVP